MVRDDYVWKDEMLYDMTMLRYWVGVRRLYLYSQSQPFKDTFQAM